MKTITKVSLASLITGAAIGVAMLSTNVNSQVTTGTAKTQVTKVNIESWPATSKKAAQMMIDKYGQPNESTSSMLVWNNNGIWKRTIVYKKETPHHFPMEHMDVIEQVIDYKVPVDKFDDLAVYNGSVIGRRTDGEISTRCDKESVNLLALNLANEIISEKISVEEAREFYSETMKGVMMGKSSSYLEKLLFNIMKGGTTDPDIAITASTK